MKLTSATGIKAEPPALCTCHLCVIRCVYYLHCGNSYSFPICVGNLSINPVTIHFKMTGVSYFKIRCTKVDKLRDEKTTEIQNADSSVKTKKQRRLLVESKILKGFIADGFLF